MKSNLNTGLRAYFVVDHDKSASSWPCIYAKSFNHLAEKIMADYFNGAHLESFGVAWHGAKNYYLLTMDGSRSRERRESGFIAQWCITEKI